MSQGASSPTQIERLLCHQEFVAALARRLVQDPAGAADVEQETWLAALRRPPTRESGLRGWLGAVVRNISRQTARADRRRSHWENKVLPTTEVSTPEEILGREASRRRLVAAVTALDEPYRTTILLRYFEGLSPSQIAQHQDVPVETVKTRLKRAHARLRQELEQEDPNWQRALLPLAIGPSLARPSSLSLESGAREMLPTVKIAFAGSIAVTILWLGSSIGSWLPDGPDEERGQWQRKQLGSQVPIAASSASPATPLPQLRPGSASAEELAIPGATLSTSDSRENRISGYVVNRKEGKTILDLGLAIWSAEDEAPQPLVFSCNETAQVQTGDISYECDNGSFSIQGLEPGAFYLVGYEISEPVGRSDLGIQYAWSTLHEAEVGTTDLELQIEESAKGALTGRLIFPPEIEEVQSLSIFWRLSPPNHPQFDLTLSQTEVKIENGRFMISGMSVCDARITISAPSFLPETRPIQIRAGSTFDCGDIAVQPALTIHGHVTDLQGTPLAGVSIGALAQETMGPGSPWWRGHQSHQVTMTDANGYFECSVLQEETKWITAALDGYALASIDATQHGGLTYDFRLHQSGGEIEVLFPEEPDRRWLRLQFQGTAPESYDHVPKGPFSSGAWLESGRHTFESLPAGSYTVMLWSQSLGSRFPDDPVPGKTFRRTVTVEEGQPTQVDFR